MGFFESVDVYVTVLAENPEVALPERIEMMLGVECWEWSCSV
mgnify:CR=1 FL=1